MLSHPLSGLRIFTSGWTGRKGSVERVQRGGSPGSGGCRGGTDEIGVDGWEGGPWWVGGVCAAAGAAE